MIWACWFILFTLIGGGDVRIRISNNSNVAMQDVRIQFPSQTELYGAIPPKGVTEYRTVKKAYRYAYIEAVVNGKPAVLQPFDYVGEKELTAGKYTYVLTISEKSTSEYDRLRLTCRRD